MYMKVTDQPGRVFAIVILCPGLIFMAYKLYIDEISRENVAKILVVFSVIFFFYELFWIIVHEPKTANFSQNIKKERREKIKRKTKSDIIQEDKEDKEDKLVVGEL